MNKDVLEEIIRVETLKKIRSIFEQMQVIRYSCYIDSLVRIYEGEEVYNCEGCILTDIVGIRREDILGKGTYPLCPLEMKTDVRVLK